jgi:hypothetical protein
MLAAASVEFAPRGIVIGDAILIVIPLQKDELAILAANRSEESHFAGGVVLHAAEDSARFSRDLDLFRLSEPGA